ncbi:MAG: helix-turn-helix domain-containing protein [Clostridia bacterium]|nr:helix-turn-helix domain-containing protein [Clostridia bacterium]
MINSNKIKGRMREKNITQAMLANKLNIAQATCCQKLNNLRQMSLDEANAISEYLDIKPEEFGSYFFA